MQWGAASDLLAEKMHILIVVPRFPALSETFVFRHVVELIGRGYDVWVLANIVDKSLLEELLEDQSEQAKLLLERVMNAPTPSGGRLAKLVQSLQALPWKPASLVLLWRSTIDLLQSFVGLSILTALPMPRALQGAPSFDLIHAQHGLGSLCAARLIESGFLDGPLVATFHGTDLNMQRGQPNRTIYAPVFRQAALCTVGSKFMTSHLTDAGLGPHDYKVLPVGVVTNDFRPSMPKEISETPVLATVGRLTRVKGVEYAIRAVSVLKEREQPVLLKLAGDGELKQELRALVHTLGVEDSVVFLGPTSHEEVRELLAEASILVHPGIVDETGACEAQGLVLAEAQAMQVPIVASRVGGIPESIVEGETAMLTPQKKPEAIADAIQELLDNPARAKRMGEAGRSFVVKQFDQSQITDRWVKIYQELTQRPSNAPLPSAI